VFVGVVFGVLGLYAYIAWHFTGDEEWRKRLTALGAFVAILLYAKVAMIQDATEKLRTEIKACAPAADAAPPADAGTDGR
jgi:hypothetical protein